ncbi:MAG TPA: HAD hydrolase-like protein, partial [Vulgatibacter sp.]
MTPPYRLAIFDFDGTLADTMEQFGTFVNRAADRFGFPRLDDAQLESLRDADAKEIVKRLRIPFWQVPRIARYMRSLGASEPIRLFGEAADLLYTLRDAGVRITIVSSNAEANIRRALGEPLVGLVERFECGVSLYGKASRIRRVVRKARVPSEHAIYVGD